MNVFEDLIEELRDENLLEQTVIDLRKGGATDSSPADSFDFAIEANVSGSRTRTASEASHDGHENQGDGSEIAHSHSRSLLREEGR